MLTRVLAPFALFLTATVFVSGAWISSDAPVAQNPGAGFTSRSIALDADLVGAGIDALELLDKASAKLGENRTGWLKTTIRQRTFEARRITVAEGFLQRGPAQCARLEMQVGDARLLVVSDGETLAHVQKVPGAKPIVHLESLPASHANTMVAREVVLNEKSCGGPNVLLHQLRCHLRHATLQTGTLGEACVIRVKGEVDTSRFTALARWNSQVATVCAYLDAASLWPLRFEWRVGDTSEAPMLQIEFLEPQIGQELSLDECRRVFTYQPSGDERIDSNLPQ